LNTYVVRPVEIHYADGKPAVERYRVAHVHGRVDRAERALGRGADEILGRRLAATGGLVASVPQQITHR
jgi:hypothetical protein